MNDCGKSVSVRFGGVRSTLEVVSSIVGVEELLRK